MGTISTVIHIRYNSTILVFIAFDSNDKKLRCVEKKETTIYMYEKYVL